MELTNLYLERIGQFDGDLKSYITVLPEIARREAREAEQALSDGSGLGPLHGIPLAYKDEYYTKGVRTTCGSRCRVMVVIRLLSWGFRCPRLMAER